jgi:integrase/recombinase XerD
VIRSPTGANCARMKTPIKLDYVPGARGGPLHDHVMRHLRDMQRLGFKRATLHYDRLLLDDLAAWMERQGLKPECLAERVMARFLAYHMRTRRSRLIPKRRTLARFLTMLNRDGVMACPSVVRCERDESWGEAFARHLREDRGCPETTVANYGLPVRRLLREVKEPRHLTSAAIVRFFQSYVERYGRAAAASATSGVKAFARFLRLRDEITSDLSLAVPKVAGWAQARLPRCLSARELQRVLDAQGKETAKERRDHAIILLLARLGLRSCEVAALRLEDVDWDEGRLLIRSAKSDRSIYLPLPADVARALARYLKTARTPCRCREVFLRFMAPVGGITRIAVGGVARSAFLRAGLRGASLGAHTFRHSLASELLRQGASLPQIGRILRHRDLSTTAIYAKVDMKVLRPLAMAWPGGAR